MGRWDSLRQRLRQPSSAAIAGIVFAIILGAVIVLLHLAAPASAGDRGLWTEVAERRRSVDQALGLVPFAGIAFLWFIAVIRAQLGSTEDRFIGTVFLGSGLLFVVLLFAAAASLKAVLALEAAPVTVSVETRAFSWALAQALLGLFGTRIAAVFMVTVATAGRRAGWLPRWLVISGYGVALALLLTPPLPVPLAGQLAFPAWVLALSVMLIVRPPATQVARP